MCYSAMVQQKLKDLGIRFEARVQWDLFEDAIRRRTEGEKVALTRGLEQNFALPSTDQEARIKALIDRYREIKLKEIQEELFAQKKRLADAERKLGAKPTKTAQKDRDIAGRQIERLKDRHERLSSSKPLPTDSRIYAFDWAPVLIWKDGARAIVPMRYHLRPFGMDEGFDRKYPGCYNARIDSLTGFWKRQFGKRHALLVMTEFFENVKRDDKNVVLSFKPKGFEYMTVPCIWDHWEAKDGASLDSFALITDEPPPEVAGAGHDRCPIFLKESAIAAWLKPDGKSEAQLFEILAQRERPFYEHAVAA